MHELEVHLFGGLDVRRAGTLLTGLTSGTSRSLLAFLALNSDRRIHRNVICGTLWGDRSDTKARKTLRTALWHLRSVLEPEKGDDGRFVRTSSDRIGLADIATVWVDLRHFECCVSEVPCTAQGPLDEEAAERLSGAAALYRGDLLEGFYDDWCLMERERLRLEYLRVLERLVRHHEAQEEWLAMLTRARQILRCDPLREHVHRQIMKCHWAMGDRPAALRQYEECARVLQEELEIEPMEETRNLFERLRNRVFRAPHPPAKPPVPEPSDSTAHPHLPTDVVGETPADLDHVLTSLYTVTRWLERKRATLHEGKAASDSVIRPGGEA